MVQWWTLVRTPERHLRTWLEAQYHQHWMTRPSMISSARCQCRARPNFSMEWKYELFCFPGPVTCSCFCAKQFLHALAFQGRNPGAVVFIPKSSTSQSAGSVGLTHSASTPSFSSYSSVNSGGIGANMTTSPQTLAHGGSHAHGRSLLLLQQSPEQNHYPHPQFCFVFLLSNTVPLADRASPMDSPGLSPTGSPRIDRRTKSPMTPAVAAEQAAAVAETLQVVCVVCGVLHGFAFLA